MGGNISKRYHYVWLELSPVLLITILILILTNTPISGLLFSIFTTIAYIIYCTRRNKEERKLENIRNGSCIDITKSIQKK